MIYLNEQVREPLLSEMQMFAIDIAFCFWRNSGDIRRTSPTYSIFHIQTWPPTIRQ